MENADLTVSVEGNNYRGRPLLTYINQVTQDTLEIFDSNIPLISTSFLIITTEIRHQS